MRKLEIGPRNIPLGKDWDTLDIVLRPNLTYLVDKRQPFKSIDSNTYDIVYISHVLEHILWYNVINYLKEIFLQFTNNRLWDYYGHLLYHL